MRLASVLFYIAAALSVVGAIAHEVLGAPKVLGPLAESGLPADVIWLHHFSWHVGTIAALTLAAMFVAATRAQSGRLFAMFATLMSAGFALFAIALAVWGDPVVWTTPAPYPWTLIAILGGAGLAAMPRSQS